jgi:hypothetical protein
MGQYQCGGGALTSADEPQYLALPHLDCLARRRGGRIRLHARHSVRPGGNGP